eukprot:COSAG05_NODE_523_length_9001_cov_3.492474_4_plen_47_part_00
MDSARLLCVVRCGGVPHHCRSAGLQCVPRQLPEELSHERQLVADYV